MKVLATESTKALLGKYYSHSSNSKLHANATDIKGWHAARVTWSMWPSKTLSFSEVGWSWKPKRTYHFIQAFKCSIYQFFQIVLFKSPNKDLHCLIKNDRNIFFEHQTMQPWNCCVYCALTVISHFKLN